MYSNQNNTIMQPLNAINGNVYLHDSTLPPWDQHTLPSDVSPQTALSILSSPGYPDAFDAFFSMPPSSTALLGRPLGTAVVRSSISSSPPPPTPPRPAFLLLRKSTSRLRREV